LTLGDRKRYAGIAAIAIVLATSLVGCQGVRIRGRDDELAGFVTDEEDDWSFPNQPQSRVPRPRFVDPKAKQGRNAEVPQSRYEKPAIAKNETKPDAASNASENTKQELPKSDPVLSTKETDLDLDGALASLPPQYRDKLKLQFEAVKQKYSDSNQDADAVKLASSAGEPSHRESRSLSDAQISSKITDEADTKITPSSTGSLADNNNTQPSPSSVSVRMSDAPSDSVNTQIASAAGPSTTAVETALAKSVQEKGKSGESGSIAVSSSPTASNVVQAGAVSNAVPAPALASQPSIASQGQLNSWRQSNAQAIENLEKQLAETPIADENLRLSQELTLRMLYVAQRRLDDALRPIESLNDNEQAFVSHQMQALYEASNPDAMPVRSRHWSLVMNSQREATNQLAATSNLEVKSLAFCTEVERYGVITKFPKTQFQADQEVLLYCEIDNVAAEKVRNGFETQLQGSYEIIDSQGRKIADQILPMEPDVCQNHRRDYFIVYKIYMPQQIASGNYQMRLTIEDMKARKFGQSQIDFQIKK
jgi:hypothetical protein